MWRVLQGGLQSARKGDEKAAAQADGRPAAGVPAGQDRTTGIAGDGCDLGESDEKLMEEDDTAVKERLRVMIGRIDHLEAGSTPQPPRWR